MWIEDYLAVLAASPLLTVYISSLLCVGVVFTSIACVLHARRMLWLYWSRGEVKKETTTGFYKLLSLFGKAYVLRRGDTWDDGDSSCMFVYNKTYAAKLLTMDKLNAAKYKED